MNPKSKFETVHPGPYEVVIFTTEKELANDVKPTETAAVLHAKRLLTMARSKHLGAAIFESDGTTRGRLRRCWGKINGEVKEIEKVKVLR